MSHTLLEFSHLSSSPPCEGSLPILSQFLIMETETHKDQEGVFPWTESVLGPREFEPGDHSFLFFMTLLNLWEVAIVQSSLGLDL